MKQPPASTHLHRILQRPHEVASPARFQNFEVFGLFQVAHPLVGLPLWVDHERPPPRARRYDRVFDAEGVVGEAGGKPLAGLEGAAEGGGQREAGAGGDALGAGGGMMEAWG